MKFLSTSASPGNATWADGGLSASSYAALYTVDSSVVDTPLTAAAKVFSSIKLAVAAAEAAGYATIYIQVVAHYQSNYAWVGADSGFSSPSSMSVTIETLGEATTCPIVPSGTFPDIVPALYPILLFRNCSVNPSANVDFGDGRQFYLENTKVSGGHHTITTRNSDLAFYSCLMGSVRFTTPTGGYLYPTLLDCTVIGNEAGVIFENCTGFSASNSTFRRFAGGTSGFVTPDAALTCPTALRGCTVAVDDTTLVGAYNCFDTGVGGTFEAKGVTFNLTGATSAVKLYNIATAVSTQPVGVIKFPATVTQATAAPASAALTTVPLDVRSRKVYGDVTLTSAVAVAAKWTIEVETGIATGVYNVIQVPTAPANSLAGIVVPYYFEVAAGRRYKFTAGGGGGVTETISHYSFTD